MKAAAARETGDRASYRPTCIFDSSQSGRKIIRIENHERATGARWLKVGETALQSAIVKFAVIRAVVGEAPSECAALERLRSLDVGNIEFDIVDAQFILA
jgi:hypothetical protein